MAEVLVRFTDPVVGPDGQVFAAQACGRAKADGLWEGWLEFLPADGGEPLRSPRETTQPNRTDALYWATGLTGVYLEGALDRALRPAVRSGAVEPAEPIFDGPAEIVDEVAEAHPADSVLNPFSVYRKGEQLLRQQLAALSPWHLVNIVRAYELSDLDPAVLNAMDETALVELIVAAVRVRAPSGVR